MEHVEISDLIETASRLSERGKGILAADESTGTIGKRYGGSWWVGCEGGVTTLSLDMAYAILQVAGCRIRQYARDAKSVSRGSVHSPGYWQVSRRSDLLRGDSGPNRKGRYQIH
mmetsp:Transcript_12273/g.25047  ORF Transcript_12273/g.25047 Transcript_12273/m.25047 type:complete len:114 (+) Transcript_12273:42-383(+)